VPVAVALVTQLAEAFPGRTIHVVADAAYHGPGLKQLPASVTWTTRLPANAALYAPAQPRLPGERGRPCLKGLRLGTPAELAATTTWTPVTVRIYGRSHRTDLAARTCLWYGCLHTRTVRVILARNHAGVMALVTTDLATPAARLTERYAARWSIEQAFADARNIPGAGEARNRTRRAVELGARSHRTSGSLSVMRSVSWRVSGRDRRTWFLLDYAYYGNTISTPQILSLISPSASTMTKIALQLAIFVVAAVPGYVLAIARLDKIGHRRLQLLGFAMMGPVSWPSRPSRA
jgi:hypothetical protein